MSFNDVKSALRFVNSIPETDLSVEEYKELTDAFRYLRNSCASGATVQNEVIADPNILHKTQKLLLAICNVKDLKPEISLCLQVGLQFLANLLVDNNHNQIQVWNSCQDVLKVCLKFDNVKVQNCTAMILYNIFLGHLEFVSDLQDPYTDLIRFTLDESKSEFALYMLELFILKSNYVEKSYQKLESEDRLIILEIIQSLVNKEHDKKIRTELLKFFVSYFIQNSDRILKTACTSVESLDPVEIVKLLDLLVAFSSNESYYLPILQNETSLLINTVMLLRSVHDISKESGNNFSMLQKISELNDVEKNKSFQEHPAFGFKGSLIRLMGNMCWKNSANQDKIRELDCVPLLLDCCNIDGRNPFIMQWAILAIRNICDKNLENQKVILSMSKDGVIDALKLEEIGITLNQETNDSGICIAPLITKN